MFEAMGIFVIVIVSLVASFAVSFLLLEKSRIWNEGGLATLLAYVIISMIVASVSTVFILSMLL